MTRLTRREFLGASAGAAAAAALGTGGCGREDGRPIEGRIVGANHEVGHLLRERPDWLRSSVAVEQPPVGVLVLGGGVSGLSAAWKLAGSGHEDFLVVDLEDQAGGTSRWGDSEVTAYPWGAHYLPVPTPESRAVRELLTELGVIREIDALGTPICDERFLCFAPQERLHLHGRWQPGLFPTLGATSKDMEQLERFRALMEDFRSRRDASGRPAFAIPMELSSQDPDLLELDRISMSDFLARHGLDSPRLRWYTEYACRDDFGSDLDHTSAWAAIHYYAARPGGEDTEVLTWPEGNGWLVRRLLEKAGPRVRTGHMVLSIEPGADDVVVRALRVSDRAVVSWRARQVVLALPKFIARHLLSGEAREALAPTGLHYSPWMVANLHVDAIPTGKGAPPSWDNVLYQSPSLGYILATHQHLSANPTRSVLTYYQPFPAPDTAKTRHEMLSTPWETWVERILADLSRAHPELRRIVRRVDVMLWGHAMIRPVVGSLWGESRRRLTGSFGRIHPAHSDASGLPLFEEAQFRGVLAAQRAMTQLGHPFRDSLGAGA